MTNVNLEPGTAGSLADLIADTDHGLYLETNRSWSIDDRRLQFQFACEVGREIRGGELGRLLRNPSYAGITPQFWAGVAKSVVDEAGGRHLPVLDATCPLVTKVHNQGKRYVAQGRVLILIGHAGHPEVEGTLGQIDGPVMLVQNEREVEALDIPPDTPVAYVTQTTLSVDDTRGIIAALERRYRNLVGPEIRDICYATQNRQSAVRELSQHVDVILVVGAKNSSNSNRLREIGEEAGIPSYLIADGSELAPQWVKDAASDRHHCRRLRARGAGRGRHQHFASAG